MHPRSSVHELCISACIKKGFHPAVIRTAKIESIVSAVAADVAVACASLKQLSPQGKLLYRYLQSVFP